MWGYQTHSQCLLPGVVLWPNIPLKKQGIRMLPPMSEPTPMTEPAAPSMLPSPPEPRGTGDKQWESRDKSVEVDFIWTIIVNKSPHRVNKVRLPADTNIFVFEEKNGNIKCICSLNVWNKQRYYYKNKATRLTMVWLQSLRLKLP